MTVRWDPEDNVDTFCGCFNCNTGEDTEPVYFRVRNETDTNTRLDVDEDEAIALVTSERGENYTDTGVQSKIVCLFSCRDCSHI